MFGHHHHEGRHGRAERMCGPRGFRGGGDWGGRGFGPGGPGGGWGAGRGRRGERALDQGDLRYLLLDLIAEKPRHGYELIREIEERMEGAYSPSPGVVYPTLTLLEETGLIASEAQGAKKLYSLTDEGRAALAEDADKVSAAKARLEEARRRFGPPPAAEVKRAMQNLHAALHGRLSRGPLSQDELRAVVDALDAAARNVERA